MAETGWETTIKDLKQQLGLIKNQALAASARFEELRRQAECTKIQSLTYQLEARRKHLARSRGVASLIKNQNNLPSAGLLAAGLTVLTAMLTQDWLTAGVTGVNGALMRHGEVEWVVCLGQNLAVAPRDSIRQGKIWVTWKSLMIALGELVVQSKDKPLGNLENIIAELLKNENIVFLPPPSTDWVTV